ncbi:hypothetical protein FPQ18DRAFT_379582 [Pyronema domesticum]|uniref:F-box domain-containing protein n=1 Tax=Pyronema omphalodes (strain CBS 100304) TaxID=1076935 RepID=U4L2W3_PYROM|nr:hypothetical protein FPQ18DRAFT_379582 [Pyronema domesticum]CCX10687.1 Similar to hypothetical protein [Tuber melanosporum Mel28]; acc. no. XP_002841004 [Pyronema omphalodes CBS 100304]
MSVPEEVTPPPKPSKPSLSTLPYDVLHAIITHIPHASSLAALSATSRNLNTFVSTSGWQIFLQSKFPSLYPSYLPPTTDSAKNNEPAANKISWINHVQELTLLSRNYDRRGFLAHELEPEILLPTGRGKFARKQQWSALRGKGSQTIGFAPVVDAAEGILAVGGGHDILLRRRGNKVEEWWLYGDKNFAAGKDDVTALKLFRPSADGEQRALVGRANQSLTCVAMRTSRVTSGGFGQSRTEAVLETKPKCTVRDSTLLERGDESLVASVLGNDFVTLHRLPSVQAGEKIKKVPIAGELYFQGNEQQPWTASFLSETRLAIGMRGSHPAVVHTITPTGFTATPVRSFGAEECFDLKVASIKAIAPFPDLRGSPDLFLAGWSAGATLLHDLRTPSPYALLFASPSMAVPVYSLLPLGRERILVGEALHSLLKVFDIRMPGGRVYCTPGGSIPTPTDGPLDLPGAGQQPKKGWVPGWATHLQPARTNVAVHILAPQRWGQRGVRAQESPVYSLAAGSPGGGSVFAGLEGSVWELDFKGEGVHKKGGRECTMYEFEDRGYVKLWKQGAVEEIGEEGPRGLWGRLDGRWREMENERD